jgi:hypothetical protein
MLRGPGRLLYKQGSVKLIRGTEVQPEHVLSSVSRGAVAETTPHCGLRQVIDIISRLDRTESLHSILDITSSAWMHAVLDITWIKYDKALP